jgi:hypothetical protein
MIKSSGIILTVLITGILSRVLVAGSYNNFNLAMYCRVREVQQMSDLDWLINRIEYLAEELEEGDGIIEYLSDISPLAGYVMAKADNFPGLLGIPVRYNT